ncbi:MAG TPA: NAD(P)H-hydrate epimerase [Clostridia bacterium]|nr:NAD(P)H-hydrate epimerase [Clostridia bacterium]
MDDKIKQPQPGGGQPAVSVERMRRSDAYTAEHSVPAGELMHRAAMGVFHAVDWHGGVAVVCGGGNNGGDGYALACILARHGIRPVVYRVGEHITDTARPFHEQARQLGVDILPFRADSELSGFDMVVDCILGTGFRGEVRDLARIAIEAVNRSGAYVVSVDINSGLDGDTGNAELAVKSDLTVSIGFYKKGMFTCAAKKYIGALVNADIGVTLV